VCVCVEGQGKLVDLLLNATDIYFAMHEAMTMVKIRGTQDMMTWGENNKCYI
jgi:hypothetical protein